MGKGRTSQSLANTIIAKAIEIATLGRSQIGICAAYGVSCEGWLKVELLRGLALKFQSSENVEIAPEAANIDLIVRAGAQQVLLELKTFPTNSGRGGKPITNFIQGVVDDLHKLARVRAEADIGLAICLAYIIPDPIPASWPNHIGKIQAAAANTRAEERIPLWEGAFAHLYVMQSK